MDKVILRRLCELALIVDGSLTLYYIAQGDFYTAWTHFGIALWWAFARVLWLSNIKS